MEVDLDAVRPDWVGLAFDAGEYRVRKVQRGNEVSVRDALRAIFARDGERASARGDLLSRYRGAASCEVRKTDAVSHKEALCCQGLAD